MNGSPEAQHSKKKRKSTHMDGKQAPLASPSSNNHSPVTPATPASDLKLESQPELQYRLPERLGLDRSKYKGCEVWLLQLPLTWSAAGAATVEAGPQPSFKDSKGTQFTLESSSAACDSLYTLLPSAAGACHLAPITRRAMLVQSSHAGASPAATLTADLLAVPGQAPEAAVKQEPAAAEDPATMGNGDPPAAISQDAKVEQEPLQGADLGVAAPKKKKKKKDKDSKSQPQ